MTAASRSTSPSSDSSSGSVASGISTEERKRLSKDSNKRRLASLAAARQELNKVSEREDPSAMDARAAEDCDLQNAAKSSEDMKKRIDNYKKRLDEVTAEYFDLDAKNLSPISTPPITPLGTPILPRKAQSPISSKLRGGRTSSVDAPLSINPNSSADEFNEEYKQIVAKTNPDLPEQEVQISEQEAANIIDSLVKKIESTNDFSGENQKTNEQEFLKLIELLGNFSFIFNKSAKIDFKELQGKLNEFAGQVKQFSADINKERVALIFVEAMQKVSCAKKFQEQAMMDKSDSHEDGEEEMDDDFALSDDEENGPDDDALSLDVSDIPVAAASYATLKGKFRLYIPSENQANQGLYSSVGFVEIDLNNLYSKVGIVAAPFADASAASAASATEEEPIYEDATRGDLPLNNWARQELAKKLEDAKKQGAQRGEELYAKFKSEKEGGDASVATRPPALLLPPNIASNTAFQVAAGVSDEEKTRRANQAFGEINRLVDEILKDILDPNTFNDSKANIDNKRKNLKNKFVDAKGGAKYYDYSTQLKKCFDGGEDKKVADKIINAIERDIKILKAILENKTRSKNSAGKKQAEQAAQNFEVQILSCIFYQINFLTEFLENSKGYVKEEALIRVEEELKSHITQINDFAPKFKHATTINKQQKGKLVDPLFGALEKVNKIKKNEIKKLSDISPNSGTGPDEYVAASSAPPSPVRLSPTESLYEYDDLSKYYDLSNLQLRGSQENLDAQSADSDDDLYVEPDKLRGEINRITGERLRIPSASGASPPPVPPRRNSFSSFAGDGVYEEPRAARPRVASDSELYATPNKKGTQGEATGNPARSQTPHPPLPLRTYNKAGQSTPSGGALNRGKSLPLQEQQKIQKTKEFNELFRQIIVEASKSNKKLTSELIKQLNEKYYKEYLKAGKAEEEKGNIDAKQFETLKQEYKNIDENVKNHSRIKYSSIYSNKECEHINQLTNIQIFANMIKQKIESGDKEEDIKIAINYLKEILDPIEKFSEDDLIKMDQILFEAYNKTKNENIKTYINELRKVDGYVKSNEIDAPRSKRIFRPPMLLPKTEGATYSREDVEQKVKSYLDAVFTGSGEKYIDALVRGFFDSFDMKSVSTRNSSDDEITIDGKLKIDRDKDIRKDKRPIEGALELIITSIQNDIDALERLIDQEREGEGRKTAAAPPAKAAKTDKSNAGLLSGIFGRVKKSSSTPSSRRSSPTEDNSPEAKKAKLSQKINDKLRFVESLVKRHNERFTKEDFKALERGVVVVKQKFDDNSNLKQLVEKGESSVDSESAASAASASAASSATDANLSTSIIFENILQEVRKADVVAVGDLMRVSNAAAAADDVDDTYASIDDVALSTNEGKSAALTKPGTIAPAEAAVELYSDPQDAMPPVPDHHPLPPNFPPPTIPSDQFGKQLERTKALKIKHTEAHAAAAVVDDFTTEERDAEIIERAAFGRVGYKFKTDAEERMELRKDLEYIESFVRFNLNDQSKTDDTKTIQGSLEAFAKKPIKIAELYGQFQAKENEGVGGSYKDLQLEGGGRYRLFKGDNFRVRVFKLDENGAEGDEIKDINLLNKVLIGLEKEIKIQNLVKIIYNLIEGEVENVDVNEGGENAQVKAKMLWLEGAYCNNFYFSERGEILSKNAMSGSYEKASDSLRKFDIIKQAIIELAKKAGIQEEESKGGNKVITIVITLNKEIYRYRIETGAGVNSEVANEFPEIAHNLLSYIEDKKRYAATTKILKDFYNRSKRDDEFFVNYNFCGVEYKINKEGDVSGSENAEISEARKFEIAQHIGQDSNYPHVQIPPPPEEQPPNAAEAAAAPQAQFSTEQVKKMYRNLNLIREHLPNFGVNDKGEIGKRGSQSYPQNITVARQNVAGDNAARVVGSNERFEGLQRGFVYLINGDGHIFYAIGENEEIFIPRNSQLTAQNHNELISLNRDLREDELAIFNYVADEINFLPQPPEDLSNNDRNDEGVYEGGDVPPPPPDNEEVVDPVANAAEAARLAEEARAAEAAVVVRAVEEAVVAALNNQLPVAPPVAAPGAAPVVPAAQPPAGIVPVAGAVPALPAAAAQQPDAAPVAGANAANLAPGADSRLRRVLNTVRGGIVAAGGGIRDGGRYVWNRKAQIGKGAAYAAGGIVAPAAAAAAAVVVGVAAASAIPAAVVALPVIAVKRKYEKDQEFKESYGKEANTAAIRDLQNLAKRLPDKYLIDPDRDGVAEVKIVENQGAAVEDRYLTNQPIIIKNATNLKGFKVFYVADDDVANKKIFALSKTGEIVKIKAEKKGFDRNGVAVVDFVELDLDVGDLEEIKQCHAALKIALEGKIRKTKIERLTKDLRQEIRDFTFTVPSALEIGLGAAVEDLRDNQAISIRFDKTKLKQEGRLEFKPVKDDADNRITKAEGNLRTFKIDKDGNISKETSKGKSKKVSSELSKKIDAELKEVLVKTKVKESFNKLVKAVEKESINEVIIQDELSIKYESYGKSQEMVKLTIVEGGPIGAASQSYLINKNGEILKEEKGIYKKIDAFEADILYRNFIVVDRPNITEAARAAATREQEERQQIAQKYTAKIAQEEAARAANAGGAVAGVIVPPVVAGQKEEAVFVAKIDAGFKEVSTKENLKKSADGRFLKLNIKFDLSVANFDSNLRFTNCVFAEGSKINEDFLQKAKLQNCTFINCEYFDNRGQVGFLTSDSEGNIYKTARKIEFELNGKFKAGQNLTKVDFDDGSNKSLNQAVLPSSSVASRSGAYVGGGRGGRY